MSNANLDPAAIRNLLRRPYPRFIHRSGRRILERSERILVLLPEGPFDLVRFLQESPPEVSRDFRIARLRDRMPDIRIVDLVELESFLRDVLP